MAYKEGIVKENVTLKVDNLRADDPIINSLSMKETLKVLDCVHPHYKNCLTILFFTGLHFNEMAGLRWKNVHLERKSATICETFAYGENGRPKTKKSNREIDLLPPVIDALTDQLKCKHKKND